MILTHDVNNKINAKEVRLQGDDGQSLGIFSLEDAQRKADEQGVDLVQLNGATNPPLCRIVDYGKFKYELTQREKEQKKKNRANAVEVKEIQLRPVTDTHDVGIKAKRAAGFLEEGDKVKVTVRFKGREIAHREMGEKILDSFCDAVGETNFKVESPISVAGRQMMMVLGPIKK